MTEWIRRTAPEVRVVVSTSVASNSFVGDKGSLEGLNIVMVGVAVAPGTVTPLGIENPYITQRLVSSPGVQLYTTQLTSWKHRNSSCV